MVTPRHVIDWLFAQQAADGLFREPEAQGKTAWLRKKLGLSPPPSRRLADRAYSREEIVGQVRLLITQQLNIQEFAEDDRFVEDLRMD